MEAIKNILENVWVQRGIWSFIVVAISGLIYFLISRFLNKKEKANTKILSQKKNKTFIRMLKSVIGYALGIVTVLMVLQIYGVDVSSMLAGVGIASIIIGFALQDALKDIFRGFDIITDNYYEIGDVIKYGDNTGQVLSINLRTTKIQDVSTGNIVSIANRNIDQVEVVAGAIYINIPMPYELPVKKSEEIAKSTIKAIAKNDNVTDASYLGLNDFADNYVKHLIEVDCDPMNKLQVRRDALRTIADILEKNKVAIPYPQLDVHSKK